MDRRAKIQELLYGLSNDDLDALLEHKKLLWVSRLKQDFALFEPPRVGKVTQIQPVEPIVELPRVSPCVDTESPQLPDFQHEFAFIDTPETINEPQIKPPKHEFLFLDDPPPIYNHIPDGYQKHPKYADYAATKMEKSFG